MRRKALRFCLLLWTFSICSLAIQAQDNQKISVDLRGKTLEAALWQLQNQTKLVFMYATEDIAGVKNLNVSVKDKTITEILDDCLKGTNLTYEIKDNAVVIKKKQKGQTVTITGWVRDSEGESLPGANVVVLGMQKGVSADIDGKYSIEIADRTDVQLVYSFIGMETKTVKYTGKKTINVTLEISANEIGEVVVEAGIIQRNKMGFTGSYKQVNREELLSVGNQNVLQSLSTIDPSFAIADNNLMGSNPNVMANISLRGGSTINVSNVFDDQTKNPNEPLFILDGFETTLEKVNDLDINRIESITVLKDAGSTAIYGSKGGNGVVVIETIKPKAGKVQIDYSGDFRVGFADLSVYDLMNAKEKLEYEIKAGRYGDINNYLSNKLLNQLIKRMEYVKSGIDTDWLKMPIRTAFTQNHSLNISGGNAEGFLYQVGVNFKNTEGVMKDSKRQSFGGNTRITYRKENISISNNLTVSVTNAYKGAWEMTGFSAFAKANPYYAAINADGSVPEDLDKVFSIYTGEDATSNEDFASNPYYNSILPSRDDSKTTSITNNTSFDWHILQNLRWYSSMQLKSDNFGSDKFVDPRDSQFRNKDYTKKGSYTSTNSHTWSYNLNTSLSYAKTFGDGHNVTFIERAAIESSQSNGSSYIATGFPKGVEGIPSFSYSYEEGTRPGYSETVKRQVSFVTAINYNYKYRYLFDFNYNNDGSTAFGRNEKFQSFWSIGAGWNAHKEPFAKDWKWMQELKLRGSYGSNGNQNVGGNISENVYTYFSGYDVFGAASYLSQFANPNLRWQVVKKTSMGVDLIALDNRLSLTLDVYNTRTNPLVVSIDQKPSSGVSSYSVNFGHLTTKGLEFTVGYYIIRDLAKQISLNVRLNGSINKSTYGGFEDALNNLNNAFKSEKDKNDNKIDAELNKNSLVKYQDGQSPDALWAVRSLGIDPATGRELFLTKDGTPTFTYSVDDRVVVGNKNPKIKGIFGLAFRYKQLTANLNLRYRIGGYSFNDALYNKVENISTQNIIYNQDRRALYDRWQKAGDIKQFKSIAIGETTPISSRFIQRDNSLSGESAKISWDFGSEKWCRSIGCQSLRLNVAMQDLFTLSSIKMERGIDYPFERSISFGVSALF